MPVCANCSQPIDKGAKFCSYCDAPIDFTYTATVDASGAVVAQSNQVTTLVNTV